MSAADGAGRTLSRGTIRAAAEELDRAERTRRQVPQLSRRHPGMTIEDAYAIQLEWTALKRARGRVIIGQKVGLTSRAMQQSSQIDEPDFGCLFDDMLFPADSTLPTDRFIVPRVEIEVAFRLKAAIEGPGCTREAVLAATECVAASVEIIDARIEAVDPETGRPRRVFDTIADDAASAGVILSGRWFDPSAVDLRWVPGILRRNGVVEETGVSAGVLDHPAHGLVWLANKLASFGQRLEAGQVVLSGSFTRPVPARPGDVFEVDFGPMGAFGFDWSGSAPH